MNEHGQHDDRPSIAQRDVSASITRRAFHRLAAGVTTFALAFATGCVSLFRSKAQAADAECGSSTPPTDFEYVVVGSGAGGGPLAANLAKAGHRVLLLEAGGTDEPVDYSVPVFHAFASEHPAMAWKFFVRHYADDAQQAKDPNVDTVQNAVFYPRAGTLGGCTAHNAMITIYPHNSDWDGMAETLGDASWRSDNMRRYFERLERCQYAKPDLFGRNHGRHGFDGWLTTTEADPRLLVRDQALLQIVKAAARATYRDLRGFFARVLPRLFTGLDPNDWRNVTSKTPEGLVQVPLAIKDGRRVGTREYIRAVERTCPQNLVVRTGALATRVLFDDARRAVGVEYLEGAHLYRADPLAHPKENGGTLRVIKATREVILAGGAFNSPQLLKLSGIGPRAELEKHGIPVVVDRPGVGENLQDRYEVGVVTEMREDFALLADGAFHPPEPGDPPDHLLEQWKQTGTGPYTTNGAVIGIVRKSDEKKPDPDLFIFGLAGYFRGYKEGYSKEIELKKRYFTWAVLKAHTNNTAGRVLLKSRNPRDTPLVNFHYFDEGNDTTRADLEAVLAGVKKAREINGSIDHLIAQEVEPGNKISTDDALREWIKNGAWGHHASCSNKMGRASDPMAVVDSNFQVHGTTGLRVVDASVFPRIPGFFIVTSVYMIAEKATDVILASARAA